MRRTRGGRLGHLIHLRKDTVVHTTTIIRAKVSAADSFGQLVHVDVDPARQQLNRAVAGFLGGYSGQTMTAYRIDLTKFIDWLDSKSVAAFDAE